MRKVVVSKMKGFAQGHTAKIALLQSLISNFHLCLDAGNGIVTQAVKHGEQLSHLELHLAQPMHTHLTPNNAHSNPSATWVHSQLPTMECVLPFLTDHQTLILCSHPRLMSRYEGRQAIQPGLVLDSFCNDAKPRCP